MIDEKLRRILDDKKLRMMLKEASPQQEIARLRAEIARLRLTAAERRAIEGVIEDYEQDGEPASAGRVAILRGLLERLGGER